MRREIKEYFGVLKDIVDKVMATGLDGDICQFDEALANSIRMIVKQTSRGRKLLFIGNGASAAIASHMATDFCKNAGMRSHAFNDSSLLTCLSNDFGYRYVFQKSIEMFGEPGDILFAISSSGKSENILRAASAARRKGLKIITFSGFDKGNPLRRLGDINFYVPIAEYGYVEVIHHSLCHCLVDIIIRNKSSFKKRK